MKVRGKVCKMQGERQRKDRENSEKMYEKGRGKDRRKAERTQKKGRRKEEERQGKGSRGKTEKMQNLESRTILQLLFATKNNLCYLTIHILLSSLFK